MPIDRRGTNVPFRFTGDASSAVNAADRASRAVRGVGRASTQAELAMRRYRRSMRQLQAAQRRLVTQANSLTRALSRIAAGASVGVGLAVREFSRVERNLNQIRALVGVSEEQMTAWGASIDNVILGTGKNFAEVTEALYDIASAGQRGAQAMFTLEASAKAAQIGLGEQKVVADLITSAMNAYGDAVLSANDATGVLIKSVRLGKIVPSELARAMSRVIPIANALSVSFNDLGAAFAALSRTGTPPDESATQIRAVLLGILKPAEQAIGAARAVGIEFTELQRNLKDRGLLQTLYELNEALGGNVRSFGRLFPNVRALAGLFDLLGPGVQRNLQIFRELQDVADELPEAWGRVSDSFVVQFDQIKAGLNSIVVELGKRFTPAILDLVGHFEAMAVAVTRAGAFDTFTAGVESAVEWIKAFSTAIVENTGLILGLVKAYVLYRVAAIGATFIAAVSAAITGMVALGAATIGTSGAMGLLHASTGGLSLILAGTFTAALVSVIGLWKSWTEVLSGVWDLILSVTAAVTGLVKTLATIPVAISPFGGISDTVEEAEEAYEQSSSLFERSIESFTSAYEIAKDRIGSVFSFIGGTLEDLTSDSKNLTEEVKVAVEELGKIRDAETLLSGQDDIGEVGVPPLEIEAPELTEAERVRKGIIQSIDLKELDALYERVKSELEELREPQQVLIDQVNDYNRIRQIGLLSEEQYIKLVTVAAEKYQESLPSAEHFRQVSAQIKRDLTSLRTPLEIFQKQIDTYTTGFQRGLIDSTDDYVRLVTGATETYREALEKAREEEEANNPILQRRAELMQLVAQRMEEARTPAERYAEEIEHLTEAFSTGIIADYQTFLELIDLAQDRFFGDTLDGLNKVASAWTNFTDTIKSAFRDTFREITNGLDSFVSRMVDSLEEAFSRHLSGTISEAIFGDNGLFRGGGLPAAQTAGAAILASIGLGGITGGNAGALTGGLVGGGLGLAQWFLGPALLGGIQHGLGSGVISNLLGGGALGNTVGLGLVSGGAGLLGGLAGGSLGSLFGREAESPFGSIAGTAFGTAVGGPVGALIGGFIGSFADAIFGGDGKKRANLGFFALDQGGAGRADFDRDRISRSFIGESGLEITGFARRAGDQGVSAAEELARIASEQDRALTRIASEYGIDIDLSGGIGGRGRSPEAGHDTALGTGNFFGSVDFNRINQAEVERAITEFSAAWFEAVADQLPERVNKLLVTSGTPDELAEAFAAAFEIDRLLDLDIFDVATDAVRQLVGEQRLLWDQYGDLSERVRTLASNGLESADALQELARGLQHQRRAAAELAVAYQRIQDSSIANVLDTATQIRETQLSEEQLYLTRRAAADEALAALRVATSPEEITELLNEINNLTQSAFSLLDEGQQASVAELFARYLEDAAEIASARVDVGLAELQSQEEIFASAVESSIDAASTMQTAADIQMDAADTFREASDFMLEAGDRHLQAGNLQLEALSLYNFITPREVGV